MSTILLVDDDEQFRTMLGESLRLAGYDVSEACDGHEGLKAYHLSVPDLVITDLIMPQTEGLEMIQEIRRLQPQVKVIAISGGSRNGPSSYLKVAKAFGARAVLAKPFTRNEILEAVESALAN